PAMGLARPARALAYRRSAARPCGTRRGTPWQDRAGQGARRLAGIARCRPGIHAGTGDGRGHAAAPPARTRAALVSRPVARPSLMAYRPAQLLPPSTGRHTPVI